MASGRRSATPDEESDKPRRPDRSWGTRLAWLVLAGGLATVVTRASLATIVQVHGDGMAPSIVDGDAVLMLRGGWSIERGDIVVYDPTPPRPPEPDRPVEPRGNSPETAEHVRLDQPPNRRLPNTAVVDVEEVETNWQRVQARAEGVQAKAFRVGRILAVPGDTVTFNVNGAALGLSVNGVPLTQKPTDPVHIALAGKPQPGEAPSRTQVPTLRASAYEWRGDTRYRVLVATARVAWPGIPLPDEEAPATVEAAGYLVLADNRDEGACCDSRVIGFVPEGQIRGEVVMRVAGNPHVTPDEDPRARAFSWLP